MSALTLHIPAASLSAARLVAHAVDAGRVPLLGQYRDPDRAQAAADVLTALHHEPYAVYRIELVTQATDDGRIRVARISAGDVAAALTLFAILPALAARYWWMFS